MDVITSDMNQPKEHTRENISLMFDEISPTYDVTNRVMTFGLDKYWRRRVATYLPKKSGLVVLDCATGTGDQLFSVMESGADVVKAVGVDLSEAMLALGRSKLDRKPYAPRVHLETASAMELPFAAETFDAVTISFGIRNIVNVLQTLGKFYRVLKPGGRVIVLEGSMPSNFFVRFFHLFYLRHLVPLIGSALSRHRSAYRYLNETIETFPCGPAMCQLLNQAGFSEVGFKPLTFGLVTIYCGEKR